MLYYKSSNLTYNTSVASILKPEDNAHATHYITKYMELHQTGLNIDKVPLKL